MHTSSAAGASGKLPDADRHHIETVYRNANLLLTHVNDLLDISKLEAGHMDVHYARADLTRIVRLAASHFESLAQQRQITYTVQTPETLPAEVDPDKIGRILFNLLGNAFKFAPAGGRVRCILGTREVARNPCATLAVHDSGPGIAPEQREVVFEPFRSTALAGGTGLGLAIVKEFVGLHGGTVSASDSPEGGALLCVELPLQAPAGAEVLEEEIVPTMFAAQATPQLVEEQPAPVIARAPGPEDLNRPQLLVLEDNPEMNRFVVEALAPEYRVAQAFTGAEGVATARRIRPDLILSDIMMPGMRGDALVHEIRRHPELDAIPIILLSALTDDESRVRLLREGAQDYVTKPFSVEELRARVRNLIRVKRAEDILRRELESTAGNVEALAGEVATR
ncbi:MAG: response regulator, partial [Gemmatimonadetes bacterium]|nr:response regulator [Gemmatimonadota bacterium]